ncbi:hypothetical protein RRG08_030797 [Elysia crispata]|uniref:Uncharacterized protein n=1 Tax=Elysia crispata TaxID=231223 RepID=A0AAE1CYF9_9GAST|nr:hypothetical protein RRG08_030797 [Elysia crispata]
MKQRDLDYEDSEDMRKEGLTADRLGFIKMRTLDQEGKIRLATKRDQTMHYNNKDISMAKGKGKNLVKGNWDNLRLLSYNRTRSLRPQEPKRTKDTKRNDTGRITRNI